MPQNKKYSFGDFTNQSFVNVSPSEFNNTDIVGSCFYQEHHPNSNIFPFGMIGVTFKRCNLDNVIVPVGNSMITEGWEKCTNKKIMVQNDLEDWILDESLNPVTKMDGTGDPQDIPAQYTREEVVNKKIWDENYTGASLPLDCWFLQMPTIQETIYKNDVLVELDEAQWIKMQAEQDWFPYDSRPTLVKSKPAPSPGASAKVVLIGRITEYRIQGKGKLYKGQTE